MRVKRIRAQPKYNNIVIITKAELEGWEMLGGALTRVLFSTYKIPGGTFPSFYLKRALREYMARRHNPSEEAQKIYMEM